MKETEPEINELGKFLSAFNKESDRGAALVAASMLDNRLAEILRNFFLESEAAEELLSGFNAPLGTFASRALATYSLGLIEKNEFKEITIIRKIRNEFGHAWQPVSFETGRVADLCRQLPWGGPREYEVDSTLRSRFNFAVCMLLTDLLWRVRLVSKEKRKERIWPNKS